MDDELECLAESRDPGLEEVPRAHQLASVVSLRRVDGINHERGPDDCAPKVVKRQRRRERTEIPERLKAYEGVGMKVEDKQDALPLD